MIKEILLSAVLAIQAAASGAQTLPVELKFSLVRQLPLIHARVDGVDATLLLDLGGAEALALRPGWPGARSDQQEVPRQLALDNGQSFPINSRTWRKASIPEGIDGYLGYGYLRKFGLMIDYGRLRMELTHPGTVPPTCGGATAQLNHIGSLAYANFDYQGSPLLLGLDTGANRNVLFASGNFGRSGQEVGLENVRWNAQAVQPGTFQVIDVSVPRLAGILGFEFFSRHLVCMDSSTGVIAFRVVQ